MSGRGQSADRGASSRPSRTVEGGYDRAFALCTALLRGRAFAFEDALGLRYVATADVLFAERGELVVVAGDAFEVTAEMLRLAVRDSRGRPILRFAGSPRRVA